MIRQNILKRLYMLALLFYKLFKIDDTKLKRKFISLNNTLVSSYLNKRGKINKNKAVLLMPHCIQLSSCDYKITGGKLENCRDCGKCIISKLKNYKIKSNLHIEIATGGSVARNIIKQVKPSVVIAVACENDLSSGILDINNIPVIGILNSRPNGPCYNTEINYNELKDAIDHHLLI